MNIHIGNLITKIKRIIIKVIDCCYILKYQITKKLIKVENIKSIEETINAIIENHYSISRFGDGELKWITNEHRKNESFQENSSDLSERLIEVLTSNNKNHLVCISPAFKDLNYCVKESKRYWQVSLGKSGIKWNDYLDNNKIYYNANITRFYMGDINKSLTKSRFDFLKRIWDGKEILIVEGNMSRLGVGNDLFDNATKITRLLAPSKNAFLKYDIILKKALILGENKLILIALGPTATILAYDLAKYGYQAIDIGHVDIEYEWFIMGTLKKVPIRGKFVNEVKDKKIYELSESHLSKYLSQVIDEVI